MTETVLKRYKPIFTAHLRGMMHLAAWWRIVRLGIKSLWLHRLRSLLTMLGLVFGVSSVIAMLAVGEGASQEAQAQIRRLGSTNIIVRSRKPQEEQSTSNQHSHVNEYGLTYKDLDRIRAFIPAVKLAVPGRIIRKDLWNATRHVDTEILGTIPWYPDLRDLTLLAGRFFTDSEMQSSANVIVIDAPAADTLFPFGDPVGNMVRVGDDYYRVIGVAAGESKSGGAAGGNTGGPLYGAQNNDDAGGDKAGNVRSSTLARAYIPLTSARTRFGETLVRRTSGSFEAERVQLHEAIVQVEHQEDVEETAMIIKEVLEKYHKKSDFEMIVPLELLLQAERTKRMFNIVLGAIAGISLLVGGIGIMNIMLASVTERTREIGIRRALGARRGDIVTQFLIETVLLSGIGGLIGVGLGIAIPFLITWVAGMATIVTVWAAASAFSISGIVGLIFGIYPALRAANMDPVEALRHE